MRESISNERIIDLFYSKCVFSNREGLRQSTVPANRRRRIIEDSIPVLNINVLFILDEKLNHPVQISTLLNWNNAETNHTVF